LAENAFEIEIRPLAKAALDALRSFDRKRVMAAIEKQLRYEPCSVSRNRKPLFGASADFYFDPPLWELRIGEYRALYDVNDTARKVRVRAVRYKPPGMTTEEVLR
jgi:mRNA-degrading endonuclease RelE of RelBE toxin-antitoxin system